MRLRGALSVRSLLTWAACAVTLLFSYLAVRDVHFGEVWDALRESEGWWCVPALAAFAISIAMRAVRWSSLFARRTRPPLSAVSSALLIGYLFNNILPARAGEAARVVALNQRAGTSRAEIVGTVVIERAYDVLSLLILLFVALPWLPEVSWLRPAALLAIALAVALATTVLLLARYGDKPLHFVLRPLRRLRFVSSERLENAGRNLAEGLSGLRDPRLAGIAFVWTMASWLMLALSAWLVTLAFDLGLGYDAGVLVVVATGVAMILPSPPAAVGIFEAATLVALDAYGKSSTEAFSYALVLHVINFLPFVLVGGLVLWAHTARMRRARSAAAPPDATSDGDTSDRERRPADGALSYARRVPAQAASGEGPPG